MKHILGITAGTAKGISDNHQTVKELNIKEKLSYINKKIRKASSNGEYSTTVEISKDLYKVLVEIIKKEGFNCEEKQTSSDKSKSLYISWK